MFLKSFGETNKKKIFSGMKAEKNIFVAPRILEIFFDALKLKFHSFYDLFKVFLIFSFNFQPYSASSQPWCCSGRCSLNRKEIPIRPRYQIIPLLRKWLICWVCQSPKWQKPFWNPGSKSGAISSRKLKQKNK